MSNHSAYPQQHEPWRPDYPQMWNVMYWDTQGESSIADTNRPSNSRILCKNLNAFSVARNAISKAMKS